MESAELYNNSITPEPTLLFSMQMPVSLHKDIRRASGKANVSMASLVRDAVRYHLYKIGDKSNPHAVQSWDLADFKRKVMDHRFPVLLYGTSGAGKSSTVMRFVQSILKSRNFHKYGIILIDVKGIDYDFDQSKPAVLKRLEAAFPGEKRFHRLQDMSEREVRSLHDTEAWPRFIRITIDTTRPETERGRDLADLIRELDGLKEKMKIQPRDIIFILDESFKLNEYPEFSKGNPYQRASLKGFASTLREYVHKTIFIGQEPFLKDIFRCVEVIP